MTMGRSSGSPTHSFREVSEPGFCRHFLRGFRLTSSSPVCFFPFSWSSVASFLTPFFLKLIPLTLYTIPALSYLQISKAQAYIQKYTLPTNNHRELRIPSALCLSRAPLRLRRLSPIGWKPRASVLGSYRSMTRKHWG
jgi:hypothetical protein